MSPRPPLPPFTPETAAQKARMAEDAWNSRDPQRVALAYSEDSRWRNRVEFIEGRPAIIAFLQRKWARELDYRLIKELWGFARTGWRCASHMNGATIPAIGFAATATKTGSSTRRV
jgi:nuclear transport factor 2 (NTF2) superfamily protein